MAVQESVWKDTNQSGTSPQTPLESLMFWYQFYRENPDWARIILWEGLERRNMSASEEAQRRKAWEASLSRMSSYKGPGQWPEGLNIRQLLLTVLAIELAPFALPHSARMITGKDPQSAEFASERKQFLQDFASLLVSGGALGHQGSTPSKQPRARRAVVAEA